VLSLEKVDVKDRIPFREMVEAYWQELMPQSIVVRDPQRKEAFFQDEFSWDGGGNYPHWIVADGCRVGFVTFQVSRERKRARINNFYVVPEKRRRGHGSAVVRWLFSYMDGEGVERIDLDVRRDNPGALAFWQAQGFGVAAYRLRQYRAPERGTAFAGALSSDMG
jgi:ribosomal protein S18 acetylase RimI-like enzyme